MEAKINHLNEFEREIEISVPWESVKEEYDDLLKQYTKLSIKGFRPGKAPLGAIESTFRNEIKNDLASRCSARLCRKALKANNMEASSPIEVKEAQLNKNQQFSLKVQFIEMPSFDLPDYYSLNLQSNKEEEQLNEISEKLLEQTRIAIPTPLIENELNYTEPENGMLTDDDKKAAEERVKLMLILKKIANKDSIEVDEKDIEIRLQAIAEENEVTTDQLKEFLLSSGGFSRLSDSVLAEYVLKYIIDLQESGPN